MQIFYTREYVCALRRASVHVQWYMKKLLAFYHIITAPNSPTILNGMYDIEDIWLTYYSPITFCLIF